MNVLEKYAAKKRLTKKMLERVSTTLYGKKPRLSQEESELLGEILGYGTGNYAGVMVGLKHGHRFFDTDKLLSARIGRGLGGVTGMTIGGSAGRGLHKLLAGKKMAKYTRRKKIVNTGLAGGGLGGLAALIATSKKRKK